MERELDFTPHFCKFLRLLTRCSAYELGRLYFDFVCFSLTWSIRGLFIAGAIGLVRVGGVAFVPLFLRTLPREYREEFDWPPR